eukprot:scaffold266_cov248-Pinguiococcus_pyrenoidosus.AAC.16
MPEDPMRRAAWRAWQDWQPPRNPQPSVGTALDMVRLLLPRLLGKSPAQRSLHQGSPDAPGGAVHELLLLGVPRRDVRGVAAEVYQHHRCPLGGKHPVHVPPHEDGAGEHQDQEAPADAPGRLPQQPVPEEQQRRGHRVRHPH